MTAIVAALVVAPSSAWADELNPSPDATTGVASSSSTETPVTDPGGSAPVDPGSGGGAAPSVPSVPSAPEIPLGPVAPPAPAAPAPGSAAPAAAAAAPSDGAVAPAPGAPTLSDGASGSPANPGSSTSPSVPVAPLSRVAVAPTAVSSANAALATLAVHEAGGAELSPGFAPGVSDYRVELAPGVSELVLEAVAADSSATVDVAGRSGGSTNWQYFLLPLGSTVLTVTVTAPDGVTTATYRVTVERIASDDTRLGLLTVVPDGTTPAFDADVLDYEVTLPNWNPIVWVAAETLDPAAIASLEVDGREVVSARFVFAQIAVPTGLTVVTVTTTAEDGLTSRTYTITIVRAAGTGPSASPSAGASGSPVPSASPSDEPSTEPSGEPSTEPSGEPSGEPSTGPSPSPSVAGEETTAPSPSPSSGVDAEATTAPSASPRSGADPRTLASTGSDALLGVLVAVALLVGGLLVTRGSRWTSTRRG
ncbi:cadherin-like beta sandwich domain-containing protein [Schumannella soli]|uniref:Cadherin-like beta-sandwich-like domain-containing protein n=1 Tax=Schumannella soli TaxID=2590779 RepID=A0A506Y6G8_9MICO|nr:cadherin-like beta sandwich domain-containing protein [Schumannella soli]TPW77622.1 hypothetical protein FJ657_02870 [Schumannella soli]